MILFLSKKRKLIVEAFASLKRLPAIMLGSGLFLSFLLIMISAWMMYQAQQNIAEHYLLSKHAIAGMKASIQILTQTVIGAFVLQYLQRD